MSGLIGITRESSFAKMRLVAQAAGATSERADACPLYGFSYEQYDAVSLAVRRFPVVAEVRAVAMAAAIMETPVE